MADMVYIEPGQSKCNKTGNSIVQQIPGSAPNLQMLFGSSRLRAKPTSAHHHRMSRHPENDNFQPILVMIVVKVMVYKCQELSSRINPCLQILKCASFMRHESVKSFFFTGICVLMGSQPYTLERVTFG